MNIGVNTSALEAFKAGMKANGLNIEEKAEGGFIKKFATGGIPGFGQMFIAREAGPELVGTVNRQTAVMNNNQIVESVAQGVSGAVANVLVPLLSSSRSQQGGNIVIQVGEEEIARVVNRGNQSLSGRYNAVLV